jgi:predicted nucleic acid-binding protein
MIARCFVDTNVLLYAGSKSPADAEKKAIARQIIAYEDIGISAQVLQEFIAAAASKKGLGIAEAEVNETIHAFMEFPVVSIDAELVLKAWAIRSRFQISYWDAAIVAAAQALGSEVIYSEDLNDGQDYGGVMVRNPFKP